MKRLFVVTLVLMFLSPPLYAEGNPFKTLWPFGQEKKTPTFDLARFTKPAPKPKKSSKTLGLPSPTRMMDSAGKTTDAAVAKTKQTWKGMQDLGKSWNPFVSKAPKPKKSKQSWLDRLMPKQPKKSTPSTVNEFLSLDRPGY